MAPQTINEFIEIGNNPGAIFRGHKEGKQRPRPMQESR